MNGREQESGERDLKDTWVRETRLWRPSESVGPGDCDFVYFHAARLGETKTDIVPIMLGDMLAVISYRDEKYLRRTRCQVG